MSQRCNLHTFAYQEIHSVCNLHIEKKIISEKKWPNGSKEFSPVTFFLRLIGRNASRMLNTFFPFRCTWSSREDFRINFRLHVHFPLFFLFFYLSWAEKSLPRESRVSRRSDWSHLLLRDIHFSVKISTILCFNASVWLDFFNDLKLIELTAALIAPWCVSIKLLIELKWQIRLKWEKMRVDWT